MGTAQKIAGKITPDGEWEIEPLDARIVHEQWEVLKQDNPQVMIRVRSQGDIDSMCDALCDRFGGMASLIRDDDYEFARFSTARIVRNTPIGKQRKQALATVTRDGTYLEFETAVSILQRFNPLVEEVPENEPAPTPKKRTRKANKTKGLTAPSRKE